MNYDDYEIDSLLCPKCRNQVNSRDCDSCNEFGEVSECCDDLCQEECIHGDGMVECRDCRGTGIQRWCPSCGADYYMALNKQHQAERKRSQ